MVRDGSRCFLLERCNGRDSQYIHVVTCHTDNDSDEFDAIHFKVKSFSHVIGLPTRDYHCHVGCFRSNGTLCGTRPGTINYLAIDISSVQLATINEHAAINQVLLK